MRVLMTSWAWPSHFYPMVPLGWALRAAGHDVLVASQPALAPTIASCGLAGVSVGTDVDIAAGMEEFFARSRRRRLEGKKDFELSDLIGKGPLVLKMFVDLAEAMTGGVLDAVESYRPDLIVHDPTTYAGPIAGARHDVPTARQLWGVDYSYRTRELEPEALEPLYRRHGVRAESVDTLGAVTLDPCPRSAQLETDYPRTRTRYVPYNGPSTLPSWLLEPSTARYRICLTWGTSSTRLATELAAAGPLLDILGELADELDIEIVTTLSDADTVLLDGRPPSPRVRVVERLALQLLLPSCDAVIHQGGMGTTMTSVTTRTPQLVIPQLPDQIVNAQQLAATGAGLYLTRDQVSAQTVRAAVTRLLCEPSFRREADALDDDLAARPPLPDTVAELAEHWAGAR